MMDWTKEELNESCKREQDALAHAAKVMRALERQKFPLTAKYLIDRIHKSKWMAEVLRIDGPTMTLDRLQIEQMSLLQNLSFVELLASRLLGLPYANATTGKKKREQLLVDPKSNQDSTD
jgi:hypothetical protein